MDFKQGSSLLDLCVQNNRELCSNTLVRKVNSEIVTSSSDCDIKAEIEEDAMISNLYSQNERFSEHPLMNINKNIKEYEIETKIEIKEEKWWLEGTSTQIPSVYRGIK